MVRFVEPVESVVGVFVVAVVVTGMNAAVSGATRIAVNRPLFCLDGQMVDTREHPRTVNASRDCAAPADRIFELIADPAQQPSWDGNDNLAGADPGQRVHAVGDIFRMTLTSGTVRENHVIEFEQGRRIAWNPAEPGSPLPGHLWRWELQPLDDGRTRVTHSYDWSELTDPNRMERARNTTTDKLQASLDRLAALVEGLPR